LTAQTNRPICPPKPVLGVRRSATKMRHQTYPDVTGSF
jgi:hypothetical protein